MIKKHLFCKHEWELEERKTIKMYDEFGFDCVMIWKIYQCDKCKLMKKEQVKLK